MAACARALSCWKTVLQSGFLEEIQGNISWQNSALKASVKTHYLSVDAMHAMAVVAHFLAVSFSSEHCA
jgi:hypothetical protein